MYLPDHLAETDPAEALELVRTTGYGHLIASIDGRIESSPLPFLVDNDLEVITGHLARRNPLTDADGLDALLVIPVTDAYVSPSWYPSKADDGRVVPTWNYEVVHLRGTLRLHADPAWKLALVTRLTDRHESTMPTPWRVSDAPDDFIDKQLRAIVGIELEVTEVTAKRKLSQNLSEADRLGAQASLAAGGPRSEAVAQAMER